MTSLDYSRYRYRVLRQLLCWRTSGFETYELFQRHYNKHVIKQREFGPISDWRYLWRADAIFRGKSCSFNPHGIPACNLEDCTRKHDSGYLRYNNRSNEAGIRHGRFIGTYFRPTDYRTFMARECAR